MACTSGITTFFNSFTHKVERKVKNIFHKETEEEREHKYQSTTHRYGSFAPVRHDASVKYFVDGHDYCWAVSEALENAKHVIFIEDWWLVREKRA
ncbi:hypothetical protein BDB00DRAFT_825218 [Zychaea mexicana]|uniref:uncharacterized protein n=1 Tax=Zychaea mexicana TaxID=64656 RepID=UPI0022FDB172|nr:uncharacterized protein BDB00DRAFT_825218 [Zychaea mexicana]KAI9493052.1 hypothetical protein BDB00DRAFT_825218 [Zychaea mexicana]